MNFAESTREPHFLDHINQTSQDDPDSTLSSARPASAVIPLAPSMNVTLVSARMPRGAASIDRRILRISALSIALGIAAALIAQMLVGLIGFFTSVAFFGHLSFAFVSPASSHLGVWIVAIPVLGGLIVGLMAKWGSAAIRGHGIPEAMEQILVNDSKIQPRVTFLKPLSSAIAIGTGGPFGAEGPIIATGGALGSLLGQLLHVTANERKVLLAAGAAAGMAAIFASPVSAVILAVELLLFELRPRSLIPVSLATVTATAVRYALVGNAAVFAMIPLPMPSGSAIAVYTLLGGFVGLFSAGITRAVYGIEDLFERLPIHWMWWPAIGGLAVGIIGYWFPATLGVGYDNIRHVINGQLEINALIALCAMKFLSWAIALGSGTSGGTLAPLFTIGGALGALGGVALSALVPQLGIDPRIAALVGMAAVFAGASRALLTSVVFAFETTREFAGLLPLLGGCTVAYLVSALLMRNTIMTEKIARRGLRVPDEYSADHLEQIRVGDVCTRQIVTLAAAHPVGETRRWLHSGGPDTRHQRYPVADNNGVILGFVARRQIMDIQYSEESELAVIPRMPAHSVREGVTLRDAVDSMSENGSGKLLVVSDRNADRVIGILTARDVLVTQAIRRRRERESVRSLRLRQLIRVERQKPVD